MNSHTHSHSSEEVTLSRDLGLFSITMIGVGGMIGAGIFVLTGIAAGVAGPALILTFLLNGIVTTFTALSYAELGSAFPEAGGGYLWVKEGLGGAQGFLAGWMSWFAHAVAGSLYALAFGRFVSELWTMAGMPTLGLPVERLTLAFMTLIILAFTAINYRGASETGAIGSIVTLAKVAILLVFVVFGILAMLRTEAWITRFTDGFMPNGFEGVLAAMGLTFIAFEGYEIIAQSGEEVVNPSRNIPKAILLSIAIAVTVYVLVGTVAIGATRPPEGLRAYEYLGQQKEVAIVEVARQVFPLGIGAVVLLFSGVVSTMSALNATTYSSSRVAFAMAWSLPIEHVAASADVMFLLLFFQVNVAVMTLRHKMPDLEREFRIPWYPAVPIIGLITQGFLAVFLFDYSPIAWYFAIGWIVVGLLAYSTYFSKIEAMEKPTEVLMEEVLVSRDYSVLVPVANQEQARILGTIGSILAGEHQGEVLALHVVRVPLQLTLGEGRHFLEEGRSYLETVIHQAKERDVPVHTVIRLGRRVASAVRKTVMENASDVILLGWPGDQPADSVYGSVIDDNLDNPPADVALVRYRARRPVRSILVPTAGGPNSHLALKMAVDMAKAGEEGPAAITLLHVLPTGARTADRVRARQGFEQALEGIDYQHVETRMVEGDTVVETVMEEAEGFDLIVTGATQEGLFTNLLIGSTAEQIARRAKVTTIIVKRRSRLLHSLMRQTVLQPTTRRQAQDPTGRVG